MIFHLPSLSQNMQYEISREGREGLMIDDEQISVQIGND